MNALDVVTTGLLTALETSASARIAFPGGRSALGLMRELSVATLPWAQITVCLVDERVVALDDAASNARCVRETLLRAQAETAPFEPLYNGASAEESITQLNSAPPPVDVVVLGMGEDGHFASLFPADTPSQGLDDDESHYVLTEAVGNPAVPRISMALNRILSAKTLVLLVSSETKRERVLAGMDRLDPHNPVSYLIQRAPCLWIEWPDGLCQCFNQGVLQ